MKFYSALAAMAGLAQSRLHLDKCPDIKYTPRFDPAQWAGDWYDIQHDKGDWFVFSGECVTQSYRQRPDGNMDFRYRVKYALLFYQYFDVGGQLQDCQLGSTDSAAYTCRSTMNAFERDPDERSFYKILDTDMSSYAILYRCND